MSFRSLIAGRRSPMRAATSGSRPLPGFGMVLRDSPHTARTRLSDVLQWARQAIGPDADRSRGDFISLVKRAEEILPAQG